MHGIKFELKQAGKIEVNSLFVWNGGIYLVIEHLADFRLRVKKLAAGWTNNPYDRWQGGIDYADEIFNGYCAVAELIYDPTSNLI